MMQKKLRFLLIGLAVAVFHCVGFSQARVQLIHNSADTANRFFDVWIGTTKVFNNLEFKTATAFVDVPITGQISIILTDSASTGPENPIAIYRRTFENNHKYLLVINGLVTPTGYTPYFEIGFNVYDFAREEASVASKTDLIFLHGSTDIAEVDIVEGNIGLISNNLTYGEYDGYFGFTPADYILFVKDNATQSPLGTFELPLVSLGLQGEAGVVLMSGFFDPSVNNFGDSFGLYLALPSGGALIPLPPYSEPMAPLQFVHNSPNLAADSLDIWIDGRLAVNNMKFRTATAFNGQPAGRSLVVAVCAPNSVNAADPIVSSTFVLTENQPVQIVLSGLTQTTGYNPPTPVALHVYPTARVGSQVPGNTDLLFCNGSTDFGSLKVVEITSTIGTLTDNLSFGQFDGYQEVLNGNYAFEVRNSLDEAVASFDVPLINYGMINQSTTVLASGFFDKIANNNGPAFGLFLVPQNGGNLIGLPPYTAPTFADVQVVHNSADGAIDSVDVWIGNQKLMTDLAFRSASHFAQVGAGSPLTVAVLPHGSVSAENPLTSIQFIPEAGKKYSFILHGIESVSGYVPAPPLALTLIENVRENAVSGDVVDVMMMHLSTDAASPADFIELNGVWLLGMEYGQRSNYMQKPVANYSIGFRHPDSANPYQYYFLPVDDIGLSGKAIMVLTSGFFNPVANSNGAGFGLWAVVPGGGKMIELSDVTGVFDHERDVRLAVYPNPAVNTVFLQISEEINSDAIVQVMSLTGQLLRNVKVGFVQGRAELDVADLHSGSYFLGASINGKTIFRRVQVVR